MPWPSGGETIAVLARWRGDIDSLVVALPDGVSRVPGPCMLTCTWVRCSVGERIELRVLVPVRGRRRMRRRLRWWPVLRVIDEGSGDGAGAAHQSLTWTVERDRRGARVVRWVDEDVTIRVRPRRLGVPVGLRWGRLARGEVMAPPESLLAPVAGRHRALVVGAADPAADTQVAPATAATLNVGPLTRPTLGTANPALAVQVEPVNVGVERKEHAVVSNVLLPTGA